MGRFLERAVQDRWRRGRPSPVASITRLTTQKLKLTSAAALLARGLPSPSIPARRSPSLSSTLLVLASSRADTPKF